MGIFNMFGDHEHRVFNYKPIYYDPKKEELRQKFGHVDGTMDKEMKDEAYVPGSYIQGSWRNGNYRRSRSSSTKVQGIIGIIGLILIFVMLWFIAKFYQLL